jgi:hypothetical protein
VTGNEYILSTKCSVKNCRSGKLLLALISIVFLRFESRRDHDHIFVLSDTFTCSEMGPPLRRDVGPYRLVSFHVIQTA